MQKILKGSSEIILCVTANREMLSFGVDRVLKITITAAKKNLLLW